MLFTDATTLTAAPPLRACWPPAGHQAGVPITGDRDRTALYGALNPAAGKLRLDEAAKWDQHSVRDHLRNVRSVCRGWDMVLFLDRGSPQTATASRELAAELGASCGPCRPPARS